MHAVPRQRFYSEALERQLDAVLLPLDGFQSVRVLRFAPIDTLTVITDYLLTQGFCSPACVLSQSKVFEKPGHHVIVVCSTTGNGDPPDNAGKFWRFVKRRTQPTDLLAKLRFTVLGLGDTNYDRFWCVLLLLCGVLL